MTAPRVIAPPTMDASTIRPLRMRYIHRPTKSAIGIVQAIVNVPQLLPGITCFEPAGRMYVFDFAGTSTTAAAGPARNVARVWSMLVRPVRSGGSITSNASGRTDGFERASYATSHPLGNR